MSPGRLGEADPAHSAISDDGTEGIWFLDLISAVLGKARQIAVVSVAAGVLAGALAFLIPPTFTAKTSLFPPQQPQSSAAAALASLGSLSSLAGTAAGVRSPSDQYVALMQSETVSDKVIDRFKLMAVYEAALRVDARQELARSVRFSVGKKDGFIAIEVDDTNPQRAADIANAYVEELRQLTSSLAVTEAQQRRLFFEGQMKQTRDKLARAQGALQTSGFGQGALRAEPRAAAEAYARLRAETTAAEVRLLTLRSSFAENAPEVVAQTSALMALRAQLGRAEQATESESGPDYISKYREFKYQEALFEMFARQYELARVDESRDGVLIQVVDAATPPERKSKPRRLMIAASAAGIAALSLIAWLVLVRLWASAGRRSAVSNQGPPGTQARVST